MNNQQFDNIIKEKAQQREANVPPDIWETITREKKKRRFPFFWLIFLLLFLSSTAIVWVIKNKNTTVHSASLEKRSYDKKENSSTGSNNNDGVLGKKNKENNQANQSRISSAGKKVVNTSNQPVADSDNDKTVNLSVNDKRDYIKGKSVLEKIKKQQVVNKIADVGKEKIFSATHNKKIVHGASKISIVNGETDTPAEQVKTNSIDDAGRIKTNRSSKIITEESLVAKSDLIETAKVVENKTNQSLQNTTTDSLIVEKILQAVKDSADKETFLVKQKKPTGKHKNTSLKIEAGITAVFPVQQYEQPAYVKRILDIPNAHSEFISDKIKPKVEPGGAFDVTLIKSLNKKWSAGTGIHFLKFTERLQLSGIETRTNYTIVQRLVTNAGGSFLKPDTVSTITKNNTTLNGRNIYQNWGIPLFIRYRFITRKKWSCSLTTGIYINLIRSYHNNIPGQFETTYASGNKQANVKNTVGTDIFAGLQFSGALYKRYEWFAGSSFSYNLTSYKTNNLSFNKKIQLPGISFGISYRLKR